MHICIFSVIASTILIGLARKTDKDQIPAIKAIAYLGVIILIIMDLFGTGSMAENSLTAAILMASVFEVGTNVFEFYDKKCAKKS